MPIPEPGIYRPSNLTRKQQQEQEAACYGVTVSNQQFSQEDIDRMRAIISQADAAQPVTTLDLNNPPKVSHPFQKFPLMMYDHVNSAPAHEEIRMGRNGEEVVVVPARVYTLIVKTERDLSTAIADGWSLDAPAYGEAPDSPLSAALQAEVNKVEEQLAEKRRAGRPSNAELDRRRKEAAAA